MKKIIAIAAATLALGACTATPQMIEAQKGRCTQIGHKPGTTAHAECVERGTMQQQATQNGVAGAAATTAISGAIIRSMF